MKKTTTILILLMIFLPLVSRGDIESPNYQIKQEGLELKIDSGEEAPNALVSEGRPENRGKIIVAAAVALLLLFSVLFYNLLKRKK